MALRLGVTGHRSLTHIDEVRRAINLAIDGALEASPPGASPRPAATLTVVSALAEGADRLVVHECLRRPGATLVAILPLPIAEYETDFETSDSQREFSELLEVATTVEIAEETPTREHAYERAGQLMVEHSDAVIAVWDGQPAAGRGGTADIVAYAEARHVPVFRVDVRPDQR
jgi:hypothetical protein